MSLDEQAGFEGRRYRYAKPVAALEAAKADWGCPYCHRHMTTNAKGNHLKKCALNPNRAKPPVKKGSKRNDLKACEFCGKGISPNAMRRHVNVFCPVASAIRDGRVTVPSSQADLQPNRVDVFDPPVTVGDGGQYSWVITAPGTNTTHLTARIESIEEVPVPVKPRFDRQTALEIINLAVDQVVDNKLYSIEQAARIVGAIGRLVDALEEALS
jgi:hypothetical protein